jgi:hypothetical protein
MANQFSSNLKSLTTKMIAAGVKALPVLSVIAVALFLFVGAAHAQGPCPVGQSPCILVSNFGTTIHSSLQQVEVWADAGGTGPLLSNFLSGCPNCTGGGAGAGEGIACLAGSTNRLYIANATNWINTFNATTGQYISHSEFNAGNGTNVAGMATNGAGLILYAGQYVPGNILSLVPSPSGLTLEATTSDPITHDLAIAQCPAGSNGPCSYQGNVFSSLFLPGDTGVNQYTPAGYSLNGTNPLQFLPGPFDGTHDCANFAGVGTHCWGNLSGIAFDTLGDLWVNSGFNNDSGTFEFAPGGNCAGGVPPAFFCPLNFTPDTNGVNANPVGLTIAPPGDPSNPGQIIIANYGTANGAPGTVGKINPFGTNCTGTPGHPGNCMAGASTFFTPGGRPKYVVYSQGCPDPDNNGDVEICKQSNPEYPVSGIFDFTATAPFFSSGTIEVPVGECSGAVEVPPGQVTLTEAPTIGDLVSNVTACSYNEFGECVPDLISWTLPDLYATVPVASGGVSSETLTTFTNYAASPGQLKVCKIAGLGTPVGTEFTFTVTGIPPFQVQAGPPGQGGFCQLVAGTFPVNTPVTIAETPNTTYPLTSATVECNACTYSINLPQSSVTTTIGAGITVASFTNTESSRNCLICRNPGIE